VKEEELGYYMYCVIGEHDNVSFGPIGLSEEEEGEDVFIVSHDGLSCIVSRSHAKNWDISRKNMLQHARVNETVMKEVKTILPFRFSTISESKEDIIEKFLKRENSYLLEKLNYFADKQEYGLKAFWHNRERVFTELLEEFPSLREERDRLSNLPFRKARNNLIAFGEKIKETFERKRELLGERMIDKLQTLAVDVKTNKLMTDKMVLNGAFLIADENQTDFDERVEKVVKETEDAVQFKYVGPAPPANFIELEVQW